MKRCSKCGQLLPLDSFSKEPTYKDGYKTVCKKCTNEYSREYRARKKDRRKTLLEIKKREPEEYLLGGIKIYILNHAGDRECKFNVVSTSGEVFNTNNREKFFEFLRGKV